MLDIGFSEIALIFVLALIVLGPEKLPRVASQVGRWIGRARGMARQFREQLEEEVNLEEARKSRPAPITPPPPAMTPLPLATATDHGSPAAAIDVASRAEHGSPAAAADAATPADSWSSPATAAQPTATDATPAPTDRPSEFAAMPPLGTQPAPTEASSTAVTHQANEALAGSTPDEPPQPSYPDWYSHAHPTDSEGRPLPPPTSDAPAVDSGQQDWVGGVSPTTDKPAQSPAPAGYAPPHERGT